VTSPASAGTNELLRTGSTPVRHARDVLDELGDFRSWDDGQGQFDMLAPRPAKLDALGRQVMAAVDSTPTSVATMVERTGLAPAALSAAAMKLEALGLIRGQPGWWEKTPR
jgi:predicted Rossmann fold nucleotide-binding protein DprA/Smf involved in DNA uptake